MGWGLPDLAERCSGAPPKRPKKALKNNKAYFSGKTDSELLRQREWISPLFIIKRAICIAMFISWVHVLGALVLCVLHTCCLLCSCKVGLGKLW